MDGVTISWGLSLLSVGMLVDAPVDTLTVEPMDGLLGGLLMAELANEEIANGVLAGWLDEVLVVNRFVESNWTLFAIPVPLRLGTSKTSSA